MSASVSVIGFGEAAMAFAFDWRTAGVEVRAYDILTDDPATAAAKRTDYAQSTVDGCATLAECLAGANLVMSLVTADRAAAAARSAAPLMEAGAFFFDCNSVAPSTKQQSAREIEAAGGRYVDVAIMAPVDPARTTVPLLVSGRDAEMGASRLGSLGFAPRVVGSAVGDASTVKMLRSVIVKGIEALTAECLLAAGRAGVLNQVLEALGPDWTARADYNLDRMLVHGLRRAAEMAEVAKTLENLEVSPRLSRSAAAWQRTLGKLRLEPDKGLAAKVAQILSESRKDAA